jgi:hypothetical protein
MRQLLTSWSRSAAAKQQGKRQQGKQEALCG